MTLKIYTDGSCTLEVKLREGSFGPGGWGFAVFRGHTKLYSDFGGENATTNNKMEMMGIIMALESVHTQEFRALEIYSDSQYVIRSLNEWMPIWSKGGLITDPNLWRTASKKPVKNPDLWKRLLAAAKGHDITWKWVKGHNGDPGNVLADKLANMGKSGVAY
jgi:ribonuclease HI